MGCVKNKLTIYGYHKKITFKTKQLQTKLAVIYIENLLRF